MPQTEEDEQADIAEQRPENAVGHRIPTTQIEQGLRSQPGNAKRSMLQPLQIKPAAVGQGRQQQGVDPQTETGRQSHGDAATTGTAPIQSANDRRSKLRHG